MSKKKFAHRQAGNATAATLTRQKQSSDTLTGFNSMSNWMMVLLLVLPILISKEAMDPTITIRYIFLGIFILLFVGYFYGLKKTMVWEMPLLVKSVFLTGLGLVAWSTISLFFAINSIAGLYELVRMLLNLVLLFLVMQLVRQEGSLMLKLFKALVIISLLHSFIGVFQFYELAFNELPGANAKPYGLMANRNLFGSAQALLLPFIIYLVYKTSGTWKILGIFAGVLTLASIILSQTRSAWLAVLAIVMVSLVLVLVYLPALRKKWLIGTVIGIGIIAFLSALIIISDSEGSLSQSVTERAVGLTRGMKDSTESSGNAMERVKIWRKTMQLVRDKPLLGTGLSNWKLAIGAYGTEGLVWAQGAFVPDRVHNVYLQMTAETGFPGLLLYIAMWLLIAFIALRTISRSSSTDRRIISILMLAGLAAFATDSMFSFPTERIEHSLYVYLMAGIILGNFLHDFNEETDRPKPPGKVLLYSFLFIAAFNTLIAFKRHNFEKHLNYAKAYEQINDYNQVLAEVEEGKSRLVNVDMVGISLETKSAVAYREMKDYTRALQESNTAKKYHPHSPMVYNNMGTIYSNMNDLPKAIECYEKALLYAPDYDIVLKNLGVSYFNTGNYAGCIKALEKVDVSTDAFLAKMLQDARNLAAQGKIQ